MKRPRVVFLVNGEVGGAMAIRARSFASRLSGDLDIRIAYRADNKILAILRFVVLLLQVRPAVCYVFDMGFSGVLGGGIYHAVSRCRMVIDTGDAIYELSRLSGSRGRVGLWLTRALEEFSLRISHQAGAGRPTSR